LVHSLFKDYHTCARSYSPPPLLAPSPYRHARKKLLKKPQLRLLKPLMVLPMQLPKPPEMLLTLPVMPLTPLQTLPATPWLPNNLVIQAFGLEIARARRVIPARLFAGPFRKSIDSVSD
jgi:hypothetical protein